MDRDTRRGFLKKGAAAGVVIGALPIVQSFDIPAFGQAGSPPVPGPGGTQVARNPTGAPQVQAQAQATTSPKVEGGLAFTGAETADLATLGASAAVAGAVLARWGARAVPPPLLEAGPKAMLGGYDNVVFPHVTPSLSALGLPFTVRTNDAALAARIDALLAPFVVTAAAAAVARPPTVADLDHQYALRDLGAHDKPRYALYRRDDLVGTADQTAAALSLLLSTIDRAAVDRAADQFLLVHASSAASAGAAVILTGPSGSGKTTLVAALVRSGFEYIADEVVAIDPESLAVAPYQKAISLEEGSRALFAEAARPAEGSEPPPADGDASQWHVPVAAIRPDALGAQTPVGCVIDVRYTPGGANVLERVAPRDATSVLIENCFNGDRLGARGFQTAVAVAQQAPCFSLRFDDLDRACELVTEALSGRTGQPAAGSS